MDKQLPLEGQFNDNSRCQQIKHETRYQYFLTPEIFDLLKFVYLRYYLYYGKCQEANVVHTCIMNPIMWVVLYHNPSFWSYNANLYYLNTTRSWL